MSTDRHKNKQQVIHVSDDAHAQVSAMSRATGKTIARIVDELILEEVATKGRKALAEKAGEALERGR